MTMLAYTTLPKQMRTILTWFLLLFSTTASVSVHAQVPPFIELGVVGDERLAVTGPALAMKVGSGVLLRAFSWKKGAPLATSGKLLASCRGLWLSNFFDGDAHMADGKWSLADWHGQARLREVAVLSDAIYFNSWAESLLPLSLPLRAKIEAICKQAAAEPRNTFLSVSSSEPNKAGVIKVSAIITGTAVRKGAVIDIWMRSTDFIEEPLIINNEPLVIEGVEQKKRVPNGQYELYRTAFDCKNRQLGTYQAVYYKSDGSNSSEAVDRAKLRFSDATPNSVGEAELEAVCMLYGPQSQ